MQGITPLLLRANTTLDRRIYLRLENETNFSFTRCFVPNRFLRSLVRVIPALSYSDKVSHEAVDEYILSLFLIFIQTSSYIRIPLLDKNLIEFVMSQQATGYPWAPSTHIKS